MFLLYFLLHLSLKGKILHPALLQLFSFASNKNNLGGKKILFFFLGFLKSFGLLNSAFIDIHYILVSSSRVLCCFIKSPRVTL